jgi:hypothetical protein
MQHDPPKCRYPLTRQHGVKPRRSQSLSYSYLYCKQLFARQHGHCFTSEVCYCHVTLMCDVATVGSRPISYLLRKPFSILFVYCDRIQNSSLNTMGITSNTTHCKSKNIISFKMLHCGVILCVGQFLLFDSINTIFCLYNLQRMV